MSALLDFLGAVWPFFLAWIVGLVGFIAGAWWASRRQHRRDRPGRVLGLSAHDEAVLNELRRRQESASPSVRQH